MHFLRAFRIKHWMKRKHREKHPKDIDGTVSKRTSLEAHTATGGGEAQPEDQLSPKTSHGHTTSLLPTVCTRKDGEAQNSDPNEPAANGHTAVSSDSFRTTPEGDSEEVLKSPIFRMLVGEEKRVMSIHANLFHGLSMPLHRMITNGMMKESLEASACLPDDDPEVFHQVAKLAYRLQSFNLAWARGQKMPNLPVCGLPAIEDDAPAFCQSLLTKWRHLQNEVDDDAWSSAQPFLTYHFSNDDGITTSLTVIAKMMQFVDKYMMEDLICLVFAGFVYQLWHICCSLESYRLEGSVETRLEKRGVSKAEWVNNQQYKLQPLWQALEFLFQDHETFDTMPVIGDVLVLAILVHLKEVSSLGAFRIMLSRTPLLGLSPLDGTMKMASLEMDEECSNCGRSIPRLCDHSDVWSFRSCDHCCLDCTHSV